MHSKLADTYNNGHLVTPPLHLNALPVIAGELTVWIAASELQHGSVRFPLVASIVIVCYRPCVLSKHIRDLAGFGHSCYRSRDVSQHPNTLRIIVLDSCCCSANYQHVARVVRQLLWGEKRVNGA